MSLVEDAFLLATIVRQGGFSHAAKYLGISNGLVSRRIAHLETNLGVTLIKRTTRQIHLTSEGELIVEYAQRLQHEFDTALSLIQASAKKTKGKIRISAPLYFGTHYLTPVIGKFMKHFPDIQINLVLSNQLLDPIKEQLDFVIRGAGYTASSQLKNSGLQMRLLEREKIGLYASPDYVKQYSQPENPLSLKNYQIIDYIDGSVINERTIWKYYENNQLLQLPLNSNFSCNNIASALIMCEQGHGIARFSQLNAKKSVKDKKLIQVLNNYDWGDYYLYVIYPQQKVLPKRTRILLDFIADEISSFLN